MVIADNTWAYASPAYLGAYAQTALGAGVSATQREQIVANHNDVQNSYVEYLGTQKAGKDLILYGLGNDALTPLKKQYINFGNAIIHTMINTYTRRQQ